MADEEEQSSASWIGVVIAVIANFLISISLNLQKHAHNTNTKNKAYVKLPWWWCGTILNALGEGGNLMAYGFAPASVVTPTGAVGVVFNAIFASLVLKEQFRVVDAIGLVCIIAGVVIVVLQSPTSTMEPTVQEAIDLYFDNARTISYLICLVVFIAVFMVLEKTKGKQWMMVYLGLCSVISSITVLSCKVFVVWLRLSSEKNNNQFDHYLPWISVVMIIVTAVWSMNYLQQAMKIWGNNQVIPIYYATFTIACITGSAVVYKELDGLPVGQIILFFVGVLLAIGGVRIVAVQRSQGEGDLKVDQGSSTCEPSTPSSDEAKKGEKDGRPRSLTRRASVLLESATLAASNVLGPKTKMGRRFSLLGSFGVSTFDFGSPKTEDDGPKTHDIPTTGEMSPEFTEMAMSLPSRIERPRVSSQERGSGRRSSILLTPFTEAVKSLPQMLRHSSIASADDNPSATVSTSEKDISLTVEDKSSPDDMASSSGENGTPNLTSLPRVEEEIHDDGATAAV